MTAWPQLPRWVSAATIVAYTVAGVLGFRNTLSWPHTIQIVLLQVTACGIAQCAISRLRTMLNYSLHVFVGLVVFAGGWTAIDGTVHAGFALAALASLLLSAGTWLGLAHVFPKDTAAMISQPSASHKEEVFIFAIPIAIAAIIGSVYAWTNTDSIRVLERVDDAMRVTSLGVVCGAILAWPLLCLALQQRRE